MSQVPRSSMQTVSVQLASTTTRSEAMLAQVSICNRQSPTCRLSMFLIHIVIRISMCRDLLQSLMLSKDNVRARFTIGGKLTDRHDGHIDIGVLTVLGANIAPRAEHIKLEASSRLQLLPSCSSHLHSGWFELSASVGKTFSASST